MPGRSSKPPSACHAEAIKAISPWLDQLITEFQTLLQKMNNLAKNSCQMAKALVGGVAQVFGEQLHGDGSIGDANLGLFSDTTAALKAYNNDPNSFLNQVGHVNPKAGNTNMKAIMASGSSAIMGMAGLGNYDGSSDDSSNANSLNNRLLVSVMGYEVTGISCQNQASDGTPDTTQQPTGSVGSVTCTGAPTITLNDLIQGGGTGSSNPLAPLTLYTCVDPSGSGVGGGGFDPQICTQMKLDPYNYPGIRAFINIELFGSADPQGSIDPSSILGQFNSGATFNWTAQQVQFIHQTGIPLLALLGRTSNPDARIAIAQKLNDHIVSCVAAAVGETLFKSANGTQNGGENRLSDATKANIEHLRKDTREQQDACLHDHRVLEVITELNESTRLISRNVK